MVPRTLVVQNQIRSTTSGIEYNDALDLGLAEVLVEEGFLSDPDAISGTLIMDLNFLRTALRDIKGGVSSFNWFDPVASTVGLITLSGARGAITNLQTFTGADDDGDTTPDYASTVFITQNSSLENAIAELDAAMSTLSGSQSGEIFKLVLIRTGGHVNANTIIDLSAPGAGWTSSGDTITWSGASDFVDNVSVFYNGTLQLNGSSSASNNDVYFAGTPDQLAFEFKIKTNDVIQIIKFPSS